MHVEFFFKVMEYRKGEYMASIRFLELPVVGYGKTAEKAFARGIKSLGDYLLICDLKPSSACKYPDKGNDLMYWPVYCDSKDFFLLRFRDLPKPPKEFIYIEAGGKN